MRLFTDIHGVLALCCLLWARPAVARFCVYIDEYVANSLLPTAYLAILIPMLTGTLQIPLEDAS
jgi:hypothetical protein